MNSLCRIPLLVAAALLFSVSLRAGQLSPDLDQQIQITPSGGKIKVWIKVVASQTVRSATSASAGMSARDQHRVAIEALKAQEGSTQAGVMGALDVLAATNKVSDIKQHWIVNVIEADVDASELTSLAARSDIESIIREPKVSLIAPAVGTGSPGDQLSPNANYYTPNLVQIKADQAHTMGFTGKGRVICTFDTGIDGAHPFLNRSWRGKGGTSADSVASWFDPVYHQRAPHIIANSLYSQHGTHVMGLAVGRNVAGDSTLGVAPDAKWISAAVIDAPGASILDGFEWAADPDGDPSTSNDMPDVINHSWGYPAAYEGCRDIFFEAIDNLDALGIVNIFAAGNEGPSSIQGVGTIRNPATRALDSLDCFAVGNIDATGANPTILFSSSRGPSACNGAIKPNVVAPGSNIISSWPGGGFSTLTGTSMSAPQVAGLAVLLRQKNPGATPSEIKKAILTSTQHLPAWNWGTLPNNDYGWGEIDCVAALNALAAPATPNLRLESYAHGTVTPGTTVTGRISLRNLGAAARTVTAQITGTHPSLTIVNGLVSFSGNILQDSTRASVDSITLQVSDTITSGSLISVPLSISGFNVSNNAPFVKVVNLGLVVQPAGTRSLATHDGNSITFTVSNFGVFGFGGDSYYPAGGAGFSFQGRSNDLYEGGLIIATDSFSVSSGIHDQLFEPMHDFKVAPGGNLVFAAPGTTATQETHSIFTDSTAQPPIGLRITQDSYQFGSADGFILMRYIIKNTSGTNLNALKFGMFMDWDLVAFNMDAGGYLSADSILWEGYNATYNDGQGPLSAPNTVRGLRMIVGNPSTALTESGPVAYIGNDSYTSGNGFTRGEKWKALVSGFGTATIHQHDSTDLWQVMATTLNLPVNATDTIVFAILAGRTIFDLQAAGQVAQTTYAAHFPIAPLPFSCVSPTLSNGSPVSNLLPTFVWNRSSDPNPGDQITYRLQISADSFFISPITYNGISDTTFTITDSLADLTDYWWRVTATDQTSLATRSTEIPRFHTDVASDVNDGSGNSLPKQFALHQNFPNPFNPVTVISFDLPRASAYQLVIHDLLGRTLKEISGHAGAGTVRLMWDASNEASGVYLYTLTAGQYRATRKMLFLK